MTADKKVGIWMDHATANLIEFTHDPLETKTLESQFTHQTKEESLSKSENVMHNKEQHEQHSFYKGLASVIRSYNNVLLFGPTNAKSELYNMLKADHNFEKINIEVQQTDKMTEHQQHAYVKAHFSK